MENRYNKIEATFKLINNKKEYFFQDCLLYLSVHGRNRFGHKFKIHPEDHALIFKLLIYFIKEEAWAEKLNIDLNKGILLSGKIGCGKTSLMHLMKDFCSKKDKYNIKSCREISFHFAKSGYETINQYTLKTNFQSRLPPICFDDLGAEQNIKHYGNECNVMAEILLSRYDEFIQNGTITHITTNLSATEIENYYGNRVRSRMRSMFNLIAFDDNAVDKRK